MKSNSPSPNFSERRACLDCPLRSTALVISPPSISNYLKKPSNHWGPTASGLFDMFLLTGMFGCIRFVAGVITKQLQSYKAAPRITSADSLHSVTPRRSLWLSCDSCVRVVCFLRTRGQKDRYTRPRVRTRVNEWGQPSSPGWWPNCRGRWKGTLQESYEINVSTRVDPSSILTTVNDCGESASG